jgi:hypothetical protein
MTDADHVPTWPELIILMCFGESEEQPFTGIVEVDDRYGDLPQTVRVHKSGSRYRVETLDGQLLFINGADRQWRFSPDGDMPVMITQEDDEGFGYGSYGYAIERPNPTRWRGDDFTTPTGPARPTSYLGRDAWEIELAPPPHKPAPIILTMDAATGMRMRWHSGRFGDVFRWTDIDHGVMHAEELFDWTGDYAWAATFDDDTPDDLREVIERDRHERAEQLAALRMPDLQVELTAHPELGVVEDDGSAHLSYDLEGFIVVERRPHSDAPWDHGVFPGESIEWSEGDVDWYVRVLDGVGSDQLAVIRAQLAEPRPDRE